MFVEHAQAHCLTWLRGGTGNAFPFGRQFHFERRRLARILFHVALARHLPLPGQPAQQLAHATLGGHLAGALLDPSLRVLRPQEFACRQLLQELRLRRAAHHRPIPLGAHAASICTTNSLPSFGRVLAMPLLSVNRPRLPEPGLGIVLEQHHRQPRIGLGLEMGPENRP
jgi:hypothetical protein